MTEHALLSRPIGTVWRAMPRGYRFIMSWPVVMGVRTSCATTLIAIGFRNSLVRRRFAAPGMSTPSRSCPITCTWCSKLRSLTSAAACSRFSRRMLTDGRVATAFPGMSFIHGSGQGDGARRTAPERRRESRLLLSLPLSRVSEVVCAYYKFERQELSRRGSRHPARAALAYLARSRTTATNTELAALLGLSRGECVPGLTRRFGARLESDAKVRRQLKSLEQELGGSDHPK